jgi:hypothetical protein
MRRIGSVLVAQSQAVLNPPYRVRHVPLGSGNPVETTDDPDRQGNGDDPEDHEENELTEADVSHGLYDVRVEYPSSPTSPGERFSYAVLSDGAFPSLRYQGRRNDPEPCSTHPNQAREPGPRLSSSPQAIVGDREPDAALPTANGIALR